MKKEYKYLGEVDDVFHLTDHTKKEWKSKMLYQKAIVPFTGRYALCKRIPKSDEKSISNDWNCSDDWQQVQENDEFISPKYDAFEFEVFIIGIVDETNEKIVSNVVDSSEPVTQWWVTFIMIPCIVTAVVSSQS